MKNTPMKWIGLFIAAGMLPLSAVAQDKGGDNWSISGWINEALIYYDDGDRSDFVQASDNGTTLGSRITLAGSTELENSGLDAGFEVILEPLSNVTPLIRANQENFDDNNGADIGVLGTSGYFGGAFGKLTLGLQSMPTDNIAVLADPSLTLWSSISPIFRGNGFFLRDEDTANDANNDGQIRPSENGPGAVWGNFLNCYTAEGLRAAGGIGLDCNGIYRNGVRYDLPTLHENLSIAISYANDDIFDIAFKYKTNLGRMQFLLYAGYAENHSVNRSTNAAIDQARTLRDASAEYDTAVDAAADDTGRNTAREAFEDALNELDTDPDDPLNAAENDLLTAVQEVTDAVGAGVSTTTATVRATRDFRLDRITGFHAGAADEVYYDEADNLQIQVGLMDPVTGIFGTFAYQDESVDADEGSISGELDSSDAWWLKVGIKKAFTSIGDTALTFQYGQYNDQFGPAQALAGVTGSEVQRIGFSIDQYFGSRLIIYGAYENLDLDISGSTAAESLYGRVDKLELITAGMTFFF